MAVNERPQAAWARRPGVRIGAIVAVALAAAFIVWLVLRDGDSNSEPNGQPTGENQTVEAIAPVAASEERLRNLSSEVGRPIYWVGPRSGHTYELTRTAQDRIFVRYLPPGVPVGTRRASYTIVGTYPVPNANDVLKALARKRGEVSFDAPRGGIAVYGTSRPTNVYLAYPGSDVQIEVYDPSPGQARTLISSGQVSPVTS